MQSVGTTRLYLLTRSIQKVCRRTDVEESPKSSASKPRCQKQSQIAIYIKVGAISPALKVLYQKRQILVLIVIKTFRNELLHPLYELVPICPIE